MTNQPPKRRHFLAWIAGGLAAVAGTGALGWRHFSHPLSTANLPARLPTQEEFLAQLHSSFSVASSELKAAPFELTEVGAVKLQKAGDRWFKTYSLTFRGKQETPPVQGLYTVTHPVLGPMELFLVPLGKPKPGPVRYEAVFTVFA